MITDVSEDHSFFVSKGVDNPDIYTLRDEGSRIDAASFPSMKEYLNHTAAKISKLALTSFFSRSI
jgi:hypothetical protein